MEDFIDKFKKKDKIENYYPTTVLLNKTNLKKYVRYIKKIVKVEENLDKPNYLKIKVNFLFFFLDFLTKEKKFLFFISQKHIKKLNNTRKNKNWSNGILIHFSNKQLVKTYKEVMRINSEIYRKEDNKTKSKQLAITYPISSNIENLDSLNFQEKDLIDFGDEKDLINSS